MSTWILLLAVAAPEADLGRRGTVEPAPCVVEARSSVGNWAFAVLPAGVQGSGVTLQRGDDLLRGFVFGSGTRLKIKGKHMAGILAGARVDLHLNIEPQKLELRGQVPGVGRAVVVSTPGRFRVIGDNVTIDAVSEKKDVMRGDLKVSDRYGQIEIRSTGCEGSAIWRRPDLVIALMTAPPATLGP
jgi:hypothetical protein